MRFLEGETLPWYAMRRTELGNRPLICAQAFGEALDLTGWSGSAATRAHLERMLNGCSPCCCASRTCAAGDTRADPFGKTAGHGSSWAASTLRRRRGTPSAWDRMRLRLITSEEWHPEQAG